MKLLLTGVTGFIGANLGYYLSEQGYATHGIIRHPIKEQSLKKQLDKVNLHLLENNDNLNRIISSVKPDLVIHLASRYLTNHDYSQISDLIKSNIEFPCKLLEAMDMNGVKKFINTGTSWQHYNSSNYDPVNLYAATKQAFEDLMQYYINAKSFSCINLKLFDTYGPNDNRGKLISLFDRIASNGETLSMSQGLQQINLVHIHDVCRAYQQSINLLIDCKNNYNEVFGVFSDDNLTLRNIASIYEKVNKVSLNIKWGELPYREREVMTPCQNLKKIPGWSTKIDIEYGLNKIYR